MKARPYLCDLPELPESMYWLIQSTEERAVGGLTLSAARGLRDAWVPRLVYDLVWDGHIDTDHEDEDEKVEHIASQDDACEDAYHSMRRDLRRQDSPDRDRLADRLRVFRALCAHVASLERAGVQAMFAAAAPAQSVEALAA